MKNNQFLLSRGLDKRQIEFLKEALKQAQRHANQHENEEVGGLLIFEDKMPVFKPLQNVDVKKESEYLPDPTEYSKLILSKEVLAYIHSHSKEQKLRASPVDLQQVKFSSWDWLIFQSNNEDYIFLGGDNDQNRNAGLVGAEVLQRVPS